jgi:hypothetical protein
MIDKGAHGTDATLNSVREILGLLDGASEDAAPPAAEPITSATKALRLSRRSRESLDSIGNADHADATTEELQGGEHFMQWLRDGIRSHRLIVNDAKALVHTVAGTAFLVSPGLFQRYVREHPEATRLAGSTEVGAWQLAQKQFERMHLHKRQHDGRNIWTCEVVGPRRRRLLHGYLLAESSALFDNALPDNPFLRLLTEVSTTDNDAA